MSFSYEVTKWNFLKEMAFSAKYFGSWNTKLLTTNTDLAVWEFWRNFLTYSSVIFLWQHQGQQQHVLINIKLFGEQTDLIIHPSVLDSTFFLNISLGVLHLNFSLKTFSFHPKCSSQKNLEFFWKHEPLFLYFSYFNGTKKVPQFPNV